MSIRTLIVDDDDLSRQKISGMLRDESDVEVVGECADGRTALSAINRIHPDLVFLDIHLPEVDGFGVLQALDEKRRPAIVFVTGHERHALRAFEAHALDYILKPFNRERLQHALKRARAQMSPAERPQTDDRISALLDQFAPSQKYLDRLVVRSAGRIVFLRANDVQWIEAEGNYARLHSGNESYLHRERMSMLEEKLDPATFVRIHRSTIVKLDQIKEVRSLPGGEALVILHNGEKLGMSRRYREKFHSSIERWQ